MLLGGRNQGVCSRGHTIDDAGCHDRADFATKKSELGILVFESRPVNGNTRAAVCHLSYLMKSFV